VQCPKLAHPADTATFARGTFGGSKASRRPSSLPKQRYIQARKGGNDTKMDDEIVNEEHLKAIEDFRREVILEWRSSVQKALDGGAKKAKRTRKSQYDIRSSSSSSTLASSRLPPPDYEASWCSKLAIWPWLLRASHSCGNTIVALTKSTTLAVENCNYRDSFNGELFFISVLSIFVSINFYSIFLSSLIPVMICQIDVFTNKISPRRRQCRISVADLGYATKQALM
jgi:hypothetical protein